MRTLLVPGFLLLVTACGGKADKSIGSGSPPPASECVAVFPDAETANDVVCNIGWACSSNSEHFQIICTALPGDEEACTCSSDQTTETPMVHVDSFVCQPMIALQVISGPDGCGFDLEM
jgi:hypothetical protein